MATDLLVAYARHQQTRGLLPRTIERTSTELHSLRASLVHGDLLRANRADVERWLDRPVSPRTRYNALCIVHCFYAWAANEGLTDSDPTARIIRPKLRRNLPRPIPDGDLELALRLASTRMRAWLSLMAFAGLRCQEVAGVRGPDVDLDAEPPGLRVVDGKGAKERVVPVAVRLEDALRAWGIPRKGLLFPTKSGRKFSPGELSRQTNQYLRDLGIGSTAHALRHWFGSTVYRRTKDPRLVQELLGHSSLASVQVYTRVVPLDGAEVVRSLNVNGPSGLSASPGEVRQ